MLHFPSRKIGRDLEKGRCCRRHRLTFRYRLWLHSSLYVVVIFPLYSTCVVFLFFPAGNEGDPSEATGHIPLKVSRDILVWKNLLIYGVLMTLVFNRVAERKSDFGVRSLFSKSTRNDEWVSAGVVLRSTVNENDSVRKDALCSGCWEVKFQVLFCVSESCSTDLSGSLRPLIDSAYLP